MTAPSSPLAFLTPDTRHAPRARWVDSAVLAGATAWLVVYVAMRVGALGPVLAGAGPAYLDALSYLPLALLTRAACARAGGDPSLDARTRRAWRWLAGAFTFEALQMVSQVVGALLGWRPMVDTQAQAVSLAIDALRYVCTFAAILSFPRAPRPGAERATYALDTLTVGAASAVLAWHFHLRAVVGETEATGWRTLFTLAYPVATLASAFGLVLLVLRRPPARNAPALRLLAATFVANVVTDAIYMRMLATGAAATTGAIFACYGVIEWLTAAAAWLQTRPPRAGAAPAPAEAEPEAAPISHLPYVAIVALFAALLVEASRPPLRGALALVVGAAAVTAAVAARQIAAQRRNRELVEARLAREAHFRALAEHGSDVVLVLDAIGRVREASPATARVLGYDAASLVGRAFADLVVDDDAAAAHAALCALAAAPPAGDRTPPPREWRLRHARGETRWLEVLGTNLLDDRAVLGIVLNGRDVTERKLLEAELTRRAYHDPLTGLANRARFAEVVAEALPRAAAAAAGARADDRAALAVLFVDLDGFKPINDHRGHAAGDRVLAVVADRLRDATRGSDTVARLGGDEFAILLERVRCRDEVAAVAARVVASLAAPIALDGGPATVGASVGVAYVESVTDATSGEALLRSADAAMYAAKAAGGGQVAFEAAVMSTV